MRRDAENLKQSSAMLVIGTKIEPLNISPCGFCGFENCDEKRKHSDIPLSAAGNSFSQICTQVCTAGAA